MGNYESGYQERILAILRIVERELPPSADAYREQLERLSEDSPLGELYWDDVEPAIDNQLRIGAEEGVDIDSALKEYAFFTYLEQLERNLKLGMPFGSILDYTARTTAQELGLDVEDTDESLVRFIWDVADTVREQPGFRQSLSM